MTRDDPLAAWRANPFFILEIRVDAPRAEVERAGQKLIGLLALGSARAGRYDTPLGPATRDANSVLQAVAALRDPTERLIYELLADIAGGDDGGRDAPALAWSEAEAAIGWAAAWPR
jgi:hypothetical protein